MKKILGIDFGLKRTGLAISDDSYTFAFPLETVASAKLMTRLGEILTSDPFEKIALGYPTRMDGSDTHITENVRLLKVAIESEFPGVSVTLVDERLTSKMAGEIILESGVGKQKRREKGVVDRVSASIILQSFLDQNRTE